MINKWFYMMKKSKKICTIITIIKTDYSCRCQDPKNQRTKATPPLPPFSVQLGLSKYGFSVPYIFWRFHNWRNLGKILEVAGRNSYRVSSLQIMLQTIERNLNNYKNFQCIKINTKFKWWVFKYYISIKKIWRFPISA